MVEGRAPRYVNEYEDRHGKLRRYLQKKGFPKIPLPTDCPLWSDELLMARDAAIAGGAKPIVSPEVVAADPGTIADVVSKFFQSEFFSTKNDYTKKTRRHLERFSAQHGSKRLGTITTKHVDNILKELNPYIQRQVRSALRSLFKFACANDLAKHDPTETAKVAQLPKSEGFTPWGEEHIEQFRKHWKLGTRERIALELLLNTGARGRSDAVKLGFQNIGKDGWIRFRPKKTEKHGAKVELPMLPELKAATAHLPSDQLLFLMTDRKAGMAPSTFGNWFRMACADAGLPSDLSAHGLRKAAAIRVAEATGGNLLAILAVLGDKDWRMAQVYAKNAQAKVALAQAYEKISSVAQLPAETKP